ncbi:MAG: TIGR04002 family protein [Oscillospiraceae bacterium]|nr:TIGR04002 family protein [Oscillospiraceae bacterium]
MKRNIIKKLVMAALFAAVIMLVTGYSAFRITGNGYIHLGDIFVYLAASFVPFPYGLAAAAVGAGLADLLVGSAIWIPGTFIIKALMALMFINNKKRVLCLRNVIAAVLAGLICTGGYYFYEAVIVGSLKVPLASIPFNLIQAGVSAAMYIIIALALDKINIKQKLERGFNFGDENF